MPMEIARHEGFHEIRIVSVDGQLPLGCFMRDALERFDVGPGGVTCALTCALSLGQLIHPQTWATWN